MKKDLLFFFPSSFAGFFFLENWNQGMNLEGCWRGRR